MKVAIPDEKGHEVVVAVECDGAIAVGRRHITVKESALLRRQVRC